MSDYLFFQLKSANIGSILIEFVFCVPVIIILLFFVNDYYRFYELKSKIKTSAYLAASMAQQLGNTRANKQLTMKDIGQIYHASGFNLFHTNSMYSGVLFGILYRMGWFYVKRINANEYQYQPIEMYASSSLKSSSPHSLSKNYSSTTIKDAAFIRSLSEDLICENDGDERVMIWNYYHHLYTIFDKTKLGFFIIPLKSVIGSNVNSPSGIKSYFQHKIVFTPKPGLFPVTP